MSREEQNDNRPETEAEWQLQSDAGSDGTSEPPIVARLIAKKSLLAGSYALTSVRCTGA